MDTFQMKIADAVGRITCSFNSTREYFRFYLTEEPPDFLAVITEADRSLEQKLLDEEAEREGLRPRRFTEPFLERNVIQRRFALFLLGRQVLLLHGSTVAVDGRAYLFTARTGVGKSTHTRLWREAFGDRARMVNDDRAFLQLDGGPVLAWGSPWAGKHGLNSNICIPLAGICLLERGSEDRIRPLSAIAALPALSEQICIPGDDPNRVQTLLTALTAAVPLWHLRCTRSPVAVRTTYEAMSGVPDL